MLGAAVVARDPDGEIKRFSVVSSGFHDFSQAWVAAGDMRRAHPKRMFIAGEMCAELTR